MPAPEESSLTPARLTARLAEQELPLDPEDLPAVLAVADFLDRASRLLRQGAEGEAAT